MCSTKRFGIYLFLFAVALISVDSQKSLAHAFPRTTCADGWESPSTGQGTCSWHGGIAGNDWEPELQPYVPYEDSNVYENYYIPQATQPGYNNFGNGYSSQLPNSDYESNPFMEQSDPGSQPFESATSSGSESSGDELGTWIAVAFWGFIAYAVFIKK